MDRHTDGPRVEGMICPACSHVDSIVEETYTRPLDSSDVIGAASFGWAGALVALTGRTSRRLRCLRCSCLFSRGPGLLTRMFWWTMVLGLLMVLFGGLAAAFQGSMSPGSLPGVRNACAWLSQNPLVAVAAVGAVVVMGLITAVVAHQNAAGERRHLYAALLKREGADGRAA